MNTIIPMVTGFTGSVFLLVMLTVRWRLPAFLALLLASYVAGFCFGMKPDAILAQITQGFGSTLGDIGLTIALGALLGVMLEQSGATIVIAQGVIRGLGGRFPGLALAITGYIVSIPIYCDSGFIILDSVRKHLANTHKVSPVFLSTVLGCALYATHTLVPPTPGPLAAIANLHLTGSLPSVLLFSLLFSLLAVVAGFIWATRYRALPLKTSSTENANSEITGTSCEIIKDSKHSHSASYPFILAILPVLVPMILITVGGLANNTNGQKWLTFIGHPVNALLVGLLCCWPLIQKSDSRDQLHSNIIKGLQAGGRIILVVGCGGAFGTVLRNSGFTELLVDMPNLQQWGLLLPFLIAALIKTAEGSATVALITASAIVAPLLPALGLDHTTGQLLVLFSCGGGAMTIAHVNDSFFWVIAEFTGMDTVTALKTLTVATFIQGITVLTAVQVMAIFLL